MTYDICRADDWRKWSDSLCYALGWIKAKAIGDMPIECARHLDDLREHCNAMADAHRYHDHFLKSGGAASPPPSAENRSAQAPSVTVGATPGGCEAEPRPASFSPVAEGDRWDK